MGERQLGHMFASLSPELRAALEAAAVLQTFDGSALAALLDGADLDVPERMVAAGVAVRLEERYRPVQELAEAALHELLPTRRRELHRRAVSYYERALASAAPALAGQLEEAYMRHVAGYCEMLIQQDPGRLAAEIRCVLLDRLVEPRHRHLVRYYRGLGEGLQDRYAAAREEFEQLLAEPDLDDTTLARTLNSSAVFARMQGDYEQSLASYEQSYAIATRLGDKVRQGLARKNMGVLHYELQDYARAEAALRESAQLFAEAETPYHEALACNELGLLCRDQGRWDDALHYFYQAAETFEREAAIDFLGRVHNNLGEIELLRGNLPVAIDYLERALQQMTSRAYAVDIELNLGLACQARGDDAAALGHYQAALDLAVGLGRREIVALSYSRIAHAEWRLERLGAAQASYSAAMQAIEATREPLRDEGLLLGLMGRWQDIYEAAVLLALERGDAAAAFEYAERARARAFADAVARHGGDLSRERATPLTAAEAAESLAPGALLLGFFTTGMRGPEAGLLAAMPPEAAAVRACLDLPRRLVLLAMMREELRVAVCPLDPGVLRASSPYQVDGRRFLKPAVLRRCYDALIAPAGELLTQANHLIVVPHGPLHHIPFATLLDPAERPLIEQVQRLSYAPSATVLLTIVPSQSRGETTSALALGYDNVDRRNLRHTEAEAQAIAELCGGAVRCGDAGLREQLAREAGRYRWLHIACHGEFNLDDPLASWLEIGPGERLSAADVLATLSLRADLVTLSACRSGVSKVLRGDEPMGLVRAFLSAGARAVLVTLWPVEDLSARLLMERFYSVLLSQDFHDDPAAALHDAQRYLRGLTSEQVRAQLERWGEFADQQLPGGERPFAAAQFWAPYVLVGGAVY